MSIGTRMTGGGSFFYYHAPTMTDMITMSEDKTYHALSNKLFVEGNSSPSRLLKLGTV